MPAVVAMPERQVPMVQGHQLRQQGTEGHRILAAGDRQQQSASAGQQGWLLQQAAMQSIVPGSQAHGVGQGSPTV